MRQYSLSLPSTALLQMSVLSLFLLLPGCATTDPRFPLDYAAGMELTYQLETAREALPAYRRMGEDFEQRGQYGEAAFAYNIAVSSAGALGRPQDALVLSQKAVEMGERSGSAGHLAVALCRLGGTYSGIGLTDKAIGAFERCAEAARQAGDSWQVAGSHTGLSYIYRKLGSREKALEHGRTGAELLHNLLTIKTFEWSRSPQGRSVLRNLERAYAATLIQGVGWSHIHLGQWPQAQDAFQKALAIGERIQVAHLATEARAGLGVTALRQKDLPGAVTHLEGALRSSPRPGMIVTIQTNLGRAYWGLGRLPEAEDALRQAVARIEDVRSLLQSEELRESFFEDKIGIYEGLLLVLLQQGKVAEAFDVSERARARAFLDLLGNRVLLSRGRSQALIAEEQALRQRIHALRSLPEDSPALRQELDLARAAYQAFLQRVRQTDREQASLMTVEPLRLAQVQALLPEGSVLLEYFVTGQGKTILWTVDRQSVAVTSIPIGRRGVAQQVQAFRDLIAARDRQADLERTAHALYARFVQPGLKDRQPRELLLVPHDALHYLPFQALMSGSNRYLLQDVPLYYYTSASLMQFTRAKAQAGPSSFFALGNPDFHNITLSLRYAQREALGINALFPGSTLATGPAATKTAVRDALANHNILHFATHADFDEADPLGSALLLAGPPGSENRLEVQEVFGLDLHASLVVLSACDTGLGKLSRADELTGMLRAFIYAGTPSVITTLWQVNDRAAYELMQEFYQHLKAERNKAEALRQAQLAIMQKYPQPYYWAAYQLTGEPR